ncbi:hypothetical protein M595_5286 [Lyngbya aestuarii BL J]|uniref:Uncharacterized protein n=1 Tax=Lyngbya aestuarii BL J TaxID=1348334 RepID=U7QCM4_9CYAN|nr:hypothetical protein M595_5286 [Lyngbya aestuarii BL J]
MNRINRKTEGTSTNNKVATNPRSLTSMIPSLDVNNQNQ